MLVDTHCHAHFRGYGEGREPVARRALEAGVRMITVGTNLATSREALAFAEAHEGTWATVGLHPNHAVSSPYHDKDEQAEAPPADGERFDAEAFRALAAHPKCVAIGECGLDYYRLEGDAADAKARQDAALRAQFDLATEAGKPVVIHCRDAHADLTALIAAYVGQGRMARRGVIHCFTGTLAEARAYAELGFLLSFSGIITFPPRKGEGPLSALQLVVQALPLASILLETDAPYLAPVPFRGTQNEPALVRHVAEKVAQLKGATFEEVARETSRNAERAFGI